MEKREISHFIWNFNDTYFSAVRPQRSLRLYILMYGFFCFLFFLLLFSKDTNYTEQWIKTDSFKSSHKLINRAWPSFFARGLWSHQRRLAATTSLRCTWSGFMMQLLDVGDFWISNGTHGLVNTRCQHLNLRFSWLWSAFDSKTLDTGWLTNLLHA